MMRPVAQATVGDFRFELHKGDDGKYKCLRSDVSDPVQNREEVTDLQDIPSTVFNIFNRLMR